MLYELPLEEEKVKPHQVTTLHLICSFAFIGAGAIIMIYNYVIPVWGLSILLAGLIILALTIFRNKRLTGKKVNPTVRVLELLIAAAIEVYSITQHWAFPIVIFGILLAAIAFGMFWERASDNKLFIYIDEEGARLPVTAKRRFLPWTEIDEIMYRFGTLSIECVGNHLFQWSITIPDFDNEIFEAFCAAQVEANRSKRRNDEW